MWSQMLLLKTCCASRKMIVAPLSPATQDFVFQQIGVDRVGRSSSSKISSSGSCRIVTMNCTFWAMPFRSSSTFTSPLLDAEPDEPCFQPHDSRGAKAETGRKTACSPTFICPYKTPFLGQISDAVDVVGAISRRRTARGPRQAPVMRLMIGSGSSCRLRWVRAVRRPNLWGWRAIRRRARYYWRGVW